MSRYKKQNIRFETNVCLRQADKYISIPRRRVGNGHKFSLWFLYISVWKYIKLFKEGEVITIMWRVFITNDVRSFYPKQNMPLSPSHCDDVQNVASSPTLYWNICSKVTGNPCMECQRIFLTQRVVYMYSCISP